MSQHTFALPGAMQFDFKMKFYASRAKTYREIWGNPDMPTQESMGSFDFTDYTNYSFVSNPAYDFVEVTSKFVEMTMTYYATGSLGVWNVKLTGHGFDPTKLRREQAFVCLMQSDYRNASGVWTSTPWGVGFIGVIKSVAPSVSPQMNGQFEMEVEGIGMYLSKDVLRARTWGKYNIAKGKNCTWSSTLLDPTPLYNKGEFVGTKVTLGPDNAVDGATFGPPAVSLAPPSGKNLYRDTPGHAYIREVYMWPPTGYGPEYQWISVSADTKYMLTKGKGQFKSYIGDDENHTCYWGTESPFPNHATGLPWYGDTGQRTEVGLFCFSRRRVEELFDTSGISWIVEWGKAMDGYTLSPTEDFVVINGGELHGPASDGVFWSTNPNYVPNVPHDISRGCSENGPTYEWFGSWNNGPINPASIPAGSGLARRVCDAPNSRWILECDTNTKAEWFITDIPSPASWVNTEQRGQGGLSNVGPAQYEDCEFAIVDLGALNCLTTQNFDPATVNASGVKMWLDSTFGLSLTGQAVVNNQRFRYKERGSDYLLVDAWYGNAFVVGAGNSVYQYDTVKGITKVGYRIRNINLWRKPNLSHIQNGELHATIYQGQVAPPNEMQPNPTPPPDNVPYEWWTEWPGPGDAKRGIQLRPTQDAVKTGLISIDLGYDPANPERHRYTKVCVVCTGMQGNGFMYPVGDPKYIADGGLFALNEIEVFMDELTSSDGSPTPANVGDVITQIFTKELNFPANRLNIQTYVWSTIFSSQTTTRAKYANVLSELLQSYGCVAVETLQGFVDVKINPWWPDDESNEKAFFTFDKTNIASGPMEYGQLNTVAQAKVICRDPQGRTTFIGVYPTTPYALGDYVESSGGPLVASSQANANKVAESVYKQNSLNSTASFTAVGPVPWLKPFMVIGLTWDQEEGDVVWSARNLWLVKSITHRIDFGNPLSDGGPSGKGWTTSFECQAFSYTVADNPAPPKPK